MFFFSPFLLRDVVNLYVEKEHPQNKETVLLKTKFFLASDLGDENTKGKQLQKTSGKLVFEKELKRKTAFF